MSIYYVAAADEALEGIAKSICCELGRRNPVFLPPGIAQGLAEYLKVVVAIHVRIANSQSGCPRPMPMRPKLIDKETTKRYPVC